MYKAHEEVNVGLYINQLNCQILSSIIIDDIVAFLFGLSLKKIVAGVSSLATFQRLLMLNLK